jgi:hypothetical protein
MKTIPEHPPCAECATRRANYTCGQTNAVVTPTGGIRCPWYTTRDGDSA